MRTIFWASITSLTLVGCSPPVIFQSTVIEYGLHRTMAGTAGGSLVAEVTGKRCYRYFANGAFNTKTHTFTLADQADTNHSTDPPNRIVVDIFDETGVRPGQVFDYVLTLSQGGNIVEEFRFRFDNLNGTSPIQRHQFQIKNNPDVTKPDEEGKFYKGDRDVGGSYVLTSTNGLGRNIQANLYFPISNNTTVYSYCGELE